MAIYDAPESLHVGTGSETVFGFNWPYLLPRDLRVTVNGIAVVTVLASPNQVAIVPAPAALSIVRIYRNTPAQNPTYLFATGIPMLPKYIDGNNKQLLYALQEGLLQFAKTQAVADAALAAAQAAQLAAEQAAASAAQQAANIRRTVRVSGSDPELPVLPPVAARANKVLGFDANGNPVGILPATGSGTELALDLANPNNPALGAGMLGYRYPGLDAVARTVYARLTDSVTVQDFGAIGDGVVNDTAAIRAALTHVGQHGGTLQFGAGKVYRIDPMSIIVERHLYVYLQGNGAALLSTNPGTSTRSITFRGKFGADLYVEKLTVDHVIQPNYLDGNGVAETGALVIEPFNYAAGEYFDTVDVHQCDIESAWWAGIRVYLPRVAYVTRCRVHNAKGSGIFGSVRESAFVSSNEVWNTSDDCIFFGGTVAVPGKTFHAFANMVGRNGAKGIGAAGFSNISMWSNTTDDTSAFGLVAYSGTEATDTWGPVDSVVFTGNTVGKVRGSVNNVSGTKSGIYVRGDAARRPRMVSFNGNSIRDTDEYAVRCDTADMVTIVGQNIDANGGVLVGGAAGYGTSKLHMVDNNIKVISNNAVALFDVDKFAITGNRLSGYTAAPIAGQRCSNGTIERNLLDGSTQAYSFTSSTNVKFGGFNYTVSAYTAGTASADPTNPVAMHRSLQQAANSAVTAILTIMGDVVLTGALSGAQGIMNLGVQPLVTQRLPVACWNGTAFTTAVLEIRNASNGLCVLYGAPAGTTRVSIQGIIKLD